VGVLSDSAPRGDIFLSSRQDSQCLVKTKTNYTNMLDHNHQNHHHHYNNYHLSALIFTVALG
jgi:hypothetical protein